MDLVVCWCEAVQVLIPWSRTRNQNLRGNSDDVHIAESSCKDWRAFWRREEEYQAGHHERSAEMAEAIWNPCNQVERSALVRRKYIAQVRTEQDVLQCWQ